MIFDGDNGCPQPGQLPDGDKRAGVGVGDTSTSSRLALYLVRIPVAHETDDTLTFPLQWGPLGVGQEQHEESA